MTAVRVWVTLDSVQWFRVRVQGSLSNVQQKLREHLELPTAADLDVRFSDDGCLFKSAADLKEDDKLVVTVLGAPSAAKHAAAAATAAGGALAGPAVPQHAAAPAAWGADSDVEDEDVPEVGAEDDKEDSEEGDTAAAGAAQPQAPPAAAATAKKRGAAAAAASTPKRATRAASAPAAAAAPPAAASASKPVGDITNPRTGLSIPTCRLLLREPGRATRCAAREWWSAGEHVWGRRMCGLWATPTRGSPFARRWGWRRCTGPCCW